jgi:four helix bundle protein
MSEMHAGKNELEDRTLRFACAMIDFVLTLPRNAIGDVIGRQVLKSGTSIGANYREANRAVSRAEFASKIGICEKEAAETQYWLEICHLKSIGDSEKRAQVRAESRELLAIFTSIGKRTKVKKPSE